jgi:hypothetical protein
MEQVIQEARVAGAEYMDHAADEDAFGKKAPA